MSATLIISGTVRKIETHEKRTVLTIPEDVYLGKEKGNRTEWHHITLWGNDAERAAKYLRKGSVVEAYCSVSYTSKDEKQFTNFNVRSIEYLSNFGEAKTEAGKEE